MADITSRPLRLVLLLALLLLALPASASADRSVYVSNSPISGDGVLSAFNGGEDGALTTLPGSPIGAGEDPNGVAISPDARHVYVANTGDDTIGAYKINADGSLTDLGGTPDGGNQPTGLGFTPDGEFLLATNRDSTEAAPSISVFSVANNGALTLVPSSPVSIGINDPRAVVVSPDGRFVYVTGRRGPLGPPASNADSAIAALTISPDGSLHTITGSPLYLAGQVNSFGASITPDGKFMYIAQSNNDKIHGLDLNPTTGAPTVMAGSPFQAAGDTPTELTIEPDGDQLWVSETFGKSVEGFSINPTTGALTQDVDPVTLSGQTHGIAVSPDAGFLYDAILSDPGVVDGFSIDGLLSLVPLAGSPFPTGAPFPDFFSIAVTPTQTPDAAFKAAGGKADVPLPFNASATTVAGGFPARYDWDFGDGFTLGNGGPKPTHVYLDDGTYEVTLTVHNDCASDAVFTGDVVSVGSSVFCNGPATATVTHEVTADSKVDGKLKAKKTQKQKQGKVVVKAKVKAGEKLTAKVKGKIKRGGKSYALKAKSKTVKAGKSKTLKLKLKKKSQAAKVLSGKSKATLKGTLTDDFGNKSKQQLEVKLVPKG